MGARLTMAWLVAGMFILTSLPLQARDLPRLVAGAAKAGKYEKIEFTIDLATSYSNPYDPDEVALNLEIRTPGGNTLTLPAFYLQPYEYRELQAGKRNADWFYPAGRAGWKARFAPQETGAYRCVATVRDRAGTARSNEVAFECVPSAGKGFVRVARKNPRFFEFSEGGTFFPIGQDLAFIGDGQYAGLARVKAILKKMGQNGANYARIWTCCGDWAMAIEWPKSAWGRSWEKKAIVATLPNRPEEKAIGLGVGQDAVSVSPSHGVGLKPSTRYRLAGSVVRGAGEGRLRIELGGQPLGGPVGLPAGQATPWQREFTTGPNDWRLPQLRLRLEGGGTAFLTGLSLKEGGMEGPELLWEADVNRPRRGWYNPQDCFMLDEVVAAAETAGIRLQLTLMERNLYMDALKDPAGAEYGQAIRDAKKIVRYAVARWGYSTAVATWEYWNEENPGLPTDRFYAEVGQFLKSTDIYHHLRATSAWGPNPKDWRHPELDVADLHWYLRPNKWGELAKDEVAAVLDRAALVRKTATERPALLSEFGLADDKWGLSPYMKQDPELEHFHNALWASALSGLSGTAMFWWWEQLDTMDAYPHYRGVASFMAGIPLAEERFTAAEAGASDPLVRVVGLQGKDRADLWLSNAEAAWGRRVIEKKTPGEIRGATLEVRGLKPGKYTVRWCETGEGKTVNKEALTVSGSGDGAVGRCPVPPFRSDIACKIRRADGW